MTGRPDHVVVVGGGITGLTAAYRLSQAGVDVTVVEPDRLGGKLQTSVVAGRAVDESADNFLLRVPWGLALCHDLEIDGELVSPVARTADVFVDGSRHPLPDGHLLGVPTNLDALAHSGLLSAEGLARVAEDLTSPADAADPAVAGRDVAIGDYLRRRLGDEVVDHLIDPLVGGINAGDTRTLSLAAVVPQLDAAARSGDPSLIRSCREQRARATASPTAPIFATPIGGMARIVDALVGLLPGVDWRVGRRVDAIEVSRPTTSTSHSGVRVTLDDGSTLDADAVVVACPAHAAAPLIAPLDAEAGATLAAIDHASVTMATFAFDADALAGDVTQSGCLVPKDQGTLVSAISFATAKWAQLRDPERQDVILRVSTGRFGDDRHLDLDRILGVRSGPTEVRIGRWERSLPQYSPGHLDRVDALDERLAGLPVVLAGAAYRGLGVPACIRQGEEAAARLGATWSTRRSLS